MDPELHQRLDEVDRFTDLGGHIAATEVETRRRIDAAAERLRGEIRAIAESFTRIDRVENAVREEIVRSRDELAGLIRRTLIDLDRRIRILEHRPPESD